MKENDMEKKSNKTVVIIVIAGVVLCLCVAVVVVIASYFLVIKPSNNPTPIVDLQITEEVIWQPEPTEVIAPTFPLETPVTIHGNVSEGALTTLETLINEIVPINDPIDLAERLKGIPDVPLTVPDTDAPYREGDSKVFWVSNVDSNENFQITAVCRYVGEHIYIWIQDGVKYNANDLKRLGKSFDEQIFPTNREFFGSEWSPGVDEDPRIFMLYAGKLGVNLGGYYSSADQLHPLAHDYSNAHEMFLISSDNVSLGDDYIYGTVAHEYQHMIHWFNDRNEETWLNEGFSMLAELINGFDPGGWEYEYLIDTDMQLTDWGTDVGQNGAHYGAAFLFTTYFLDRFGEEATKAVVAHPENGFTSIDAVMQELGIINPLTGSPYISTDIFADWAVANILQSRNAAGGIYGYKSYSPMKASITEEIYDCPAGSTVRDVNQYGVDSIEFQCDGSYTLNFNGVQEVKVVPPDFQNGQYAWWSNMGDESDMTLTRAFDFSNVAAPIELTFQTWHDLEEDYDYAYIMASVDGSKWDILTSQTCMPKEQDPSGNSYGCGWNGQTNGWIEERIDLSAYAGKAVQLRFEYITDAAVNGVGMVIDDIRIDAIDYFENFEAGDGGWDAAGFVLIQNTLPQLYEISVIRIGSQTTVERITLDANQSAQIAFTIGGDVDRVILVVSGTTPLTREKAIYQYSVE